MLLPSRSSLPEIMDGDAFTEAELEGNLSDLARYNRITGGIAVLKGALGRMIRGVPRGSRIAILDVGAGGGDVAAALGTWALHRGYRPRVVAADLSPRFLRIARSRARGSEPLSVCAADGRALPWRDGAFDVAVSSLVIHHLGSDAIRLVLGEMRRVTRFGFAVLDLRRSALSLAVLVLLTRMTTRNRLTLHDGPLSVRRALTVAELRTLASRALAERAVPDGGGRLRVRLQGAARLLITYTHPANGNGR